MLVEKKHDNILLWWSGWISQIVSIHWIKISANPMSTMHCWDLWVLCVDSLSLTTEGHCAVSHKGCFRSLLSVFTPVFEVICVKIMCNVISWRRLLLLDATNIAYVIVRFLRISTTQVVRQSCDNPKCHNSHIYENTPNKNARYELFSAKSDKINNNLTFLYFKKGSYPVLYANLRVIKV